MCTSWQFEDQPPNGQRLVKVLCPCRGCIRRWRRRRRRRRWRRCRWRRWRSLQGASMAEGDMRSALGVSRRRVSSWHDDVRDRLREGWGRGRRQRRGCGVWREAGVGSSGGDLNTCAAPGRDGPKRSHRWMHCGSRPVAVRNVMGLASKYKCDGGEKPCQRDPNARSTLQAGHPSRLSPYRGHAAK